MFINGHCKKFSVRLSFRIRSMHRRLVERVICPGGIPEPAAQELTPPKAGGRACPSRREVPSWLRRLHRRRTVDVLDGRRLDRRGGLLKQVGLSRRLREDVDEAAHQRHAEERGVVAAGEPHDSGQGAARGGTGATRGVRKSSRSPTEKRNRTLTSTSKRASKSLASSKSNSTSNSKSL